MPKPKKRKTDENHEIKTVSTQNTSTHAYSLNHIPGDNLIADLIPNLDVKSFINLTKTNRNLNKLKNEKTVQPMYRFFQTLTNVSIYENYKSYLNYPLITHWDTLYDFCLSVPTKQVKGKNSKKELLESFLVKSDEEINQLLKKTKFNLFFQTNVHISPFSVAAFKGNLELVYQLIETCIDNKKRKGDVKHIDEKEFRGNFEVYISDIANIRINKVRAVSYFRNKDKKFYLELIKGFFLRAPHYKKDRDNYKQIFNNAIEIACKHKNWDIAKFFINIGFDIQPERFLSIMDAIIKKECKDKELIRILDSQYHTYFSDDYQLVQKIIDLLMMGQWSEVKIIFNTLKFFNLNDQFIFTMTVNDLSYNHKGEYISQFLSIMPNLEPHLFKNTLEKKPDMAILQELVDADNSPLFQKTFDHYFQNAELRDVFSKSFTLLTYAINKLKTEMAQLIYKIYKDKLNSLPSEEQYDVRVTLINKLNTAYHNKNFKELVIIYKLDPDLIGLETIHHYVSALYQEAVNNQNSTLQNQQTEIKEFLDKLDGELPIDSMKVDSQDSSSESSSESSSDQESDSMDCDDNYFSPSPR